MLMVILALGGALGGIAFGLMRKKKAKDIAHLGAVVMLICLLIGAVLTAFLLR